MPVVKMNVSELIEDLDLYPRVQVDSQHAGYIADALRNGNELPPIVAESKGKRIIDGFHRVRAYRRVYGDDHQIDVDLRTYRSEADMFADAMRLNASHGRCLTRVDRARCLLKAKQRFRMSLKTVSSILGMSVESVKAIGEGRVATNAATQEKVPIKRTIQHVAGHELTDRQLEANSKLSGMEQAFYANQLIELIESDLLDMGNANLLERLEHLMQLLNGMFASIGAE